MAVVALEAVKVDLSTLFAATKNAEQVQTYKNAGTFQTTLEAVKMDLSALFAATKNAEQVQTYKNAGTFQVTNEAIKPMQGKIYKVRG